ncbi:hypothetical protein GAYE_SCF41G5522 [Galdieria yellowstonensis]|uniref:Reverse transcriptase domain-containing protein n=1 Tax=Galdieria yellowstonensis TaxID=3028027 RepID=A0AAV9IJU1_9RHOD|nr:hypothetical protein GAYE_SCF41G5522 [Galdieria yellowstonensis]
MEQGNASCICMFHRFTKAFDRVPHEALFRKLESLGIRGRCLEFYRGLYRSSWTQVSSRISDTLSPACPFCRGVRQGDPSSPLLFDLFINDLLEQYRPFGIRVVGMPESCIGTENRLPGLMFADDVVLLSPSRHCLKASMRKVSEYLTKFEMEVGASKCGVTVFHGCVDKVRRSQWQLQGKDIPVVEEYRYLGIDLNCNLDGFTVRRQIQRYRQKLHMATPFLRNGRIPMDLRLRVVKSCLLPSLLWGSEWWGMHQLHAKRLSLVLNQTLRMVVAGRRARLWAKGPSMRTWIRQLCQWIPTFRKGTWVKNTKAWLLRRLGSSAVREIERSPRGSKALQRTVQQVIHQKWLTTGKMTQTNTWQEYCQYALQSGSALLRDSSLDFPEYSKSLSWLMRIRVGGWSSCSRLARIGILDEQWKTRCPCCLVDVPETLSHLLCECTRWGPKRLGIFGPMAMLLTKIPAIFDGSCYSLLGGRFVATTSLEENSNGISVEEMQEKKALDEAIHRWWTTGEFTYQACTRSTLVALELDNVSSQCGFRTDLPGFILVGQFLEAVMGIRMSIIDNLRRFSLDSDDVNNTTTSRRPEGYGEAIGIA